MSRIRTIKPEFWRSEALSALPEATHMLAAALINYADDEGYFNANPRLVQAECCPLRDPSVSIQCSLTELSNVGYLELGQAPDGRVYGRICNFDKHQVINRPTDSKIKPLQISWSAHGVLSEASVPEQGTGKGNREQGNGSGKIARSAREASRKTRLPDDWHPSDLLTDDLLVEGFSLSEIQKQVPRFRDHWKSNGEMKIDWDATFRNWIRRAPEFAGRGGSPPPAKRSSLMDAVAKQMEKIERGQANSAIEDQRAKARD